MGTLGRRLSARRWAKRVAGDPGAKAMRAFQFDGQRFVGAGKSKFPAPMMSMPGGTLTVSANGNQAGSAILWASIPEKHDANIATVQGILRAFDAADVEKELWNSGQNPRDKLGMLAKFCPPVVANGKVYMATFAEPGGKSPNRLVVYGLLPVAPQPSLPSTTERKRPAGIGRLTIVRVADEPSAAMSSTSRRFPTGVP